MTDRLAPTLLAWLDANEAVIRIRVVRAAGSTPREAGAAMLVTARAARGTIGGGRLEHGAIGLARAMLKTGDPRKIWDVPLGPEGGQCCGGHVWLEAARADRGTLAEIEVAEAAARPLVLLFGAGHVGRALARALALLPLRVRWVDHRREEFEFGLEGRIEIVASMAWEREIAEAPPGSACVILTHSHALDSVITAAALERGGFPYVGLIGSRTKRRRFERAFRALGLSEAQLEPLVCPIGARGVRDKRPEIIAALTAAELIEVFAAAEQNLLTAEAGPGARPTAPPGSECQESPRSPKTCRT